MRAEGKLAAAEAALAKELQEKEDLRQQVGELEAKQLGVGADQMSNKSSNSVGDDAIVGETSAMETRKDENGDKPATDVSLMPVLVKSSEAPSPRASVGSDVTQQDIDIVIKESGAVNDEISSPPTKDNAANIDAASQQEEIKALKEKIASMAKAEDRRKAELEKLKQEQMKQPGCGCVVS